MFFAGLAKFLQLLIDIIGVSINLLILLFPPSPFKFTFGAFSDLLSKINYFVPVAEFVAITEAWVVSVALFYAYSVYARFLKAVQ